MKINWKEHAPLMLVQSAAASMTAGFRLKVHKTDDYPFAGALAILLQQEEGEHVRQPLIFDEERNACLDFSSLCFGTFVLSIIREDGSAMPEDTRTRIFIDGEEMQGDTASFSLTLEQPWVQVMAELSADYSELTVHVMEDSAQGTSLPLPTSRYQYEIIGPDGTRREELSAENHFEKTLRLPRGSYQIRPLSGACTIYVDDVLSEGTLTITADQHWAALIEQRSTAPAVRVRALRSDGNGTCFPFKGEEITAILRGNTETMQLRLTEENGFSVSLYDLSEGTYSLSAVTMEGCEYVILTDGEENGGIIEVQGEQVKADIVYFPVRSDPAGSLRIRKMIRTERGCLIEPDEGERFCVCVCGCGVTHTFLLNAENHFTAQLADLCPGCYQISEQKGTGYATEYVLADGTILIDGMLELDGCRGADVIVINEQRNNGKLQICKYVEDEQGCLSAPSGSCYAVRVHSFAFQETFMLNAKNDYCIALDQLPKGCYDIRESEGENVLYSVDQGEWSRSARVIIDDARVHEVRILNLNEPRTGTIRIEKLVENDRCVLMQPERSEYFQVCISSSQMRRMITLNAANQWCVYVDELPYGEYRIEELYEDEAYYMVNGTRKEEAVITLGQTMQEVKIINILPRGCTLKLDARMEDCEGRTVCPDDDFETVLIVQGDALCKEIRLCADNRWQAELHGLCAERISVRVKENMGYDIYYESCGRRSESCAITMGETSTVSVVHRYAHCQGSVCVEKRIEDECGSLCFPDGQTYAMRLYGEDVEVPFVLNEANGYCVWFDDLHRGTYEIKEEDMCPCAFIVDDQHQEEGSFQLSAQDVHVLVVNPPRQRPMLQIQARVRDDQGNVVLPKGPQRFALMGQGIHRVVALSAEEGFLWCADDLPAGTYVLHGADGKMYTCLIDGEAHEQARFILDQEDISVIMIEEPCACVLHVCCRLRDTAGRTIMPPASYRCHLTLSQGQESVRLCLEENGDFCCRADGLCPGKVTIMPDDDHYASYVNGKRIEGNAFILSEGETYVELIKEVAAASIRIDGMCRQGEDYHECAQGTIDLILRGPHDAQTLTLNEANGWSITLSKLLPGDYVLCSPAQNVCFYAGNTKSCNEMRISLNEQDIAISAVLQEAQLAEFSVVTRDEQGNVVAPRPEDIFTVRLTSRCYFETLVFSNADDWQLRRSIFAGIYEMYANAPSGYRFDHAEADGTVISGAKADLQPESSVSFYFTRRSAETGNVLYVQGCRRDSDCDCLKQPLPQTVFTLELRHEDQIRTLILNEENQWRVCLHDLEDGAYALSGEGYAYIVDGEPMAQAELELNGGTHHVKVIHDEELAAGALIMEAWMWDGEQLVKPQDELSLWAEVSGNGQEWQLLLDSSNHWLVSLTHLQPGVYQVHADQENVWYQIEDQTPSQEGLAVIKEGEVQMRLLLARSPLKKGSIHLRKYIQKGNELMVPWEGEYTFILSHPGFEERITLNADNQYHEEVSFLDAGTYVLDEQDTGTVTYRVDGGSEVSHAVIEVREEPVEVQAINHLGSGGGTLVLKLENGSEPIRFLLQKNDVEYEIELNAENGFQRQLEGIEAGLYALSAKSDDKLLYACDGQEQREHCSIRFDADVHTVTVIPDSEATAAATLKLQLWAADDRGIQHLPRNQEKIRVTLAGAQERVIELSAAAGYVCVLDDLPPGEASLHSSSPCMYRIDGREETAQASFSMREKETIQVDIIVKENRHHQPPTRLVL